MEWYYVGDLDWPLNASRGFVSISWASYSYWPVTYSRALDADHKTDYMFMKALLLKALVMVNKASISFKATAEYHISNDASISISLFHYVSAANVELH